MSPELGRIDALDGRPVGQVALIVPDLESALERYATLWGIAPWVGYIYGPDTVPRLTYRGEAGRFTIRLALSRTKPQLELIQPLTGPSIYDEWLETHREGLHHVGVYVESIDAAIASMKSAGYDVIQLGAGYGAEGDGGFAYFDTERDFSVIVEAIEIPRRRREPDFTWP